MAPESAQRAESSTPDSCQQHINAQQRTKHRRRDLQQQCLKPSGLHHWATPGSRTKAWLFLLGITDDHVRAHASTLQAEQPSGLERDNVKQDLISTKVPLDADGWQVADNVLQAESSSSLSSNKQNVTKNSVPADDGWKIVKHKKSKRRKDAETAMTASEPNSPDPSDSMQSSTALLSEDDSPTMSGDPSHETRVATRTEGSSPRQTAQEPSRTHQQPYPKLSSRDIEQVTKDVDRSFIGPAFQHLFSSNSDGAITPSQDKALRRKQLTHLILTTLSRYPSLHYFQGYHDIVAVILLTLSPERPFSSIHLFPDDHQQAQIELIVERISLHLIRDSMTRDLLPIMGQLKILGSLLRSVDPSFAELVDRASPLPFFALPWLLTLLTHDVTDVAVMQRVLEFVLAYGPAAAIYLCAAVLLARKDEIEGMDVDELEDPAMLHTILGRLPSIIADEAKDSADSIDTETTHSTKGSRTERRNGNSSSDSNLIYTDPDVELPSLASDRALAASSRSGTEEKPKDAKKGMPISTMLQEAVVLMERVPLSSDALEANKIMGPSSVLFTWTSVFNNAPTLNAQAHQVESPAPSTASEPVIDWQTLNAQAESALTGPTDAIVRDPHPPPPTPPASDLDEKLPDEKHPHRKRRLSLSEQTHQGRMLAVVGLSGLLVAALFTASQQGPVTTASQVVAGGTEETKRVLALVVSLLSSWGRVVGSAQ